MATYPDINIEIDNDYRLVDIVAARFDAGVRLGEQVAQDMIALRIGADYYQKTVAAPDYLAAQGTPQVPHDLMDHDCVLLRLADFRRAVSDGLREGWRRDHRPAQRAAASSTLCR